MSRSLFWRATFSYLTVALATLAGVVGMGLLFTAVTHDTWSLVFVGIPLLLVGLHWAGGALARSMLRSRHRRSLS